MSIFIHYVDKALILGRLINFLVTGKAEIKAQVCWLQKTCSKSLYGTFPNTLNHIACTEGNSFRLKVCLTRGDTNENYDKAFRLEWLSTTWDVIAAIKLWEKPGNTGKLLLLTLMNWGLKECAVGYLKCQLVTSTIQNGSESWQAG